MARHSHWHNIQLKKGKTDAKKANIFAKLAKNITVAAKDGGGDPSFNFKLRMAIDAAKSVSLPRENIERAIQRGTGGGEGGALEEVIYEGFGAGGVAFLVVCLTDNRNRTVAEVKTAAAKNGGTIGAVGSVMWMFEKKGVISFEDANLVKDRDAFELAMIEAGADDVRFMEDGVEIVCEVRDLQQVSEAVASQGISDTHTTIGYLPKTTVASPEGEVRVELENMIEAIEDIDDVDTVYTNEA